MQRLAPATLISLFFLATSLQATINTDVTVAGNVITTAGAPIAGARVEALPVLNGYESGRLILDGHLEPVAATATETNAQGDFRLAVPRSGMWRILVWAEGFVPMQLSHIAVVEPRRLAPVRLAVDHGARMRVVDNAGQPRVGVWVWADNPNESGQRGGWRSHFRAGLTDAQGWISFPRATAEALRVRVIDDATVSAEKTVSTLEETIRTDFTGVATRTLALAPEGTETVLLRGGPLAWPVGFLEAGSSLAFQDVVDAPQTLWQVKADGRRETFEVAADAGREAPWRVTPAVSAVLSGHLFDETTRRPLAGAVVWAGAEPGTFSHSDAQGRYSLAVPSGNRFWIQAEAAGYRPRAAWITPEQVAGGEVPTLGLTPAVTLAGQVVDTDGKPLPRAQVAAVPRRRVMTDHEAFQPDPADARTQSHAGGNFNLAGLQPGRDYELRVSLPGYAAVRLPVAAPDSSRANASRPGIVVRLESSRNAYGLVLDDDGRPIAGAEVILTAAGERRPMLGAGNEESTNRGVSDAEGRFTIPKVPAREVEITASSPGFARLVVRGVELPTDGTGPSDLGPIDLGTIVLVPATGIDGRVVDTEGEGLADVPVFAVPARISPDALAASIQNVFQRRTPDALTDANGSFRVTGHIPGERLHLYVGGDEHAATWVRHLEVPLAEPLRVVLEAGLGVSGRVVDTAGEAIPDAELELRWTQHLQGLDVETHRPGQKARRGDVEGRFSFNGLRPGPMTLNVWAPGFQEAEPLSFELAEDERKNLTVVLEAGATLRGHVRTASGQPLDSVRVSAGRPGGHSDAEGNYRLDGITPGPVHVNAYHPHYGLLEEEVEIRMGEQTLNLTYPDGHEVVGRVIDDSGQPLAGVALELGHEGRRAPPQYHARSAEDGSFRLAPVADGEYQVKAVREGVVLRGPKLIRVAGQDLRNVSVVLEAGAVVSGTVSGLGFDDLSRLQVHAERSRDGYRIYGDLDYSGAFEIRDLPPGAWVLQGILAGGRRQVQERLEIPPGGAQIQQDLSFAGLYILSGTVTLDGEPLSTARVSLSGRDLAIEREVITDPAGRFLIEDLEQATYNLGILHDREIVVHNRDVELTADEDILVNLVPARVGGRVVDADSGSPLADALVALVRLSASGEETNALTAATSSDGSFDFPRAPAGNYQVSVRRDGYSAESWPLELADGAVRRDLELEVQPTPGAELRVALESGQVPRTVRIAVFDSAGNVFLREGRPVDQNGRVSLPRVPHGIFQVLVESPGMVPADATLEVPGEPVELTLEQAGQLEIQVPDLLTSDAVATLELVGPRPWIALDPYGLPVSEWPVVAGRATVTGVPAGLWSIRVTAANGQTWSGSADAVPGKRLAVDLR